MIIYKDIALLYSNAFCFVLYLPLFKLISTGNQIPHPLIIFHILYSSQSRHILKDRLQFITKHQSELDCILFVNINQEFCQR